MSGQQISQCQECRVSAHITCSYELLADCTPLKNEDKPTAPVLTDLEETSKIESWITIWE